MDCANTKKNAARCNCTCGMLAAGHLLRLHRLHRASGELPACYFTPAQERTYDRSIAHFVRANR